MTGGCRHVVGVTMHRGPEQHLDKSQAGIGPFSITSPAGYPTAFDISPGQIVSARLSPGPGMELQTASLPRRGHLLMQPVCEQGWSAFSPLPSKPLRMRSSSGTTVYRACGGNVRRTVYRPIRISEDVGYREGGVPPDREEGEEEGW